jgi:hypothetical protein
MKSLMTGPWNSRGPTERIFPPAQLFASGLHLAALYLDPKLAEWECFYIFSRPHGAFNGRASYEILRERL